MASRWIHANNRLVPRPRQGYLLWFLTEEEAREELGLAEAAADGSDGTVVGSATIKPAQLQELRLTAHVFSERFKATSGGKRISVSVTQRRDYRRLTNSNV